MLDLIPISLIYALPIVPVFLLCWIFQAYTHRLIDRLSDRETDSSAQDVVHQLLCHAKIQDVAIERSEDYSQNAYVSEENKILLSPDTINGRDVASIGFALVAGSHAICSKHAMEKITLLNTLKMLEVVLFWIVFTILSFGIMAGNLSISLIGYFMGIVVLLLYQWKVAIAHQINRYAVDYLESQKKFSTQEIQQIKQVIRTESMKF